MANVFNDSIGGGFGGFGGFGGWGGFGGGYGCGIPAVGLFGIADGFGRHGFGDHNGHCGHDCDCHKHQHTEEVILEDSHHGEIINSIGQLKAEVGAKADAITDKLFGIDRDILETKFQSAINTKDIIKNTDDKFCQLDKDILINRFELSKQLSDCCCKLETEGFKNTQKILDTLCTNEIQGLRDRLNRCEKDNDLFRIASSFRQTAVTNGSNFNTGTQSTSTNSGQIVG